MSKRSGIAKFPKSNQNIEGCNAVRMWIKPHGTGDDIMFVHDPALPEFAGGGGAKRRVAGKRLPLEYTKA